MPMSSCICPGRSFVRLGGQQRHYLKLSSRDYKQHPVRRKQRRSVCQTQAAMRSPTDKGTTLLAHLGTSVNNDVISIFSALQVRLSLQDLLVCRAVPFTSCCLP